MRARPQVTRRVVQINRQRPTTIQASEVRDEADVLMIERGRLRARTFRQVEGVYSLRAEAIDGQRVQVRLTPELDHGELRNRYAGSDQGIFLMTPSRNREVFDELAVQCSLMPGEVLVLGCLPDAKASLGGVFHTSSVNGRTSTSAPSRCAMTLEIRPHLKMNQMRGPKLSRPSRRCGTRQSY